MHELKTYKVDVEFRRGPSFSTEVEAYGRANAENEALRFARECGWAETVRKVTATEKVPA